MSRIALAAVVALVAAAPVFAQTGTITGTVTATDGGQPIAGAQVRAGTAIGAVTRADGRYSLRVAPGAYTVRVTRLGFAADSLPNVSVAADASATANFQLRQAATQLGEVRVTVPYGGEQSGREQTGAVASVTTKPLMPVRTVSSPLMRPPSAPIASAAGTAKASGKPRLSSTPPNAIATKPPSAPTAMFI